MRIGQEWLRGVAAMAGLPNDIADTPQRRLRCASALARCRRSGRPSDVIASSQLDSDSPHLVISYMPEPTGGSHWRWQEWLR